MGISRTGADGVESQDNEEMMPERGVAAIIRVCPYDAIAVVEV